jgi:lysophospholipase L1-like esterase
MVGVDSPSRFETNALGIRGPDFAPSRRKEYRILFIGGSSTECFYLDQDATWPALVGERLGRTSDGRKVWAGNAGRSGHNSRDHLLEMRLLIPRLDVDAVVVTMGVNDLGLRLAQDAAFNPGFLDSGENVTYQIGHAFSVHPEDPNLAFYRKGALGRLLGLDPDAQRRKPYQVVDGAGMIFLKWREYRKLGPKVDRLPDLTAALGEYAGHVAEMASIAAKEKLRLIFVTQPALWRAGLTPAESDTLWLGGVGDFQEKAGASYYTAEALAEGLAAYDRTLMESCAKAGAECLDLAPTIKRDLSVFYDDCHFNGAGARAVAEGVASHLAERPPFVSAKKP